MHYLERNPFSVTNGRTTAALLTGVVRTVFARAPSFDPGEHRQRYVDRVAAVVARARSMLSDGSALPFLRTFCNDADTVVAEAESAVRRYRELQSA